MTAYRERLARELDPVAAAAMARAERRAHADDRARLLERVAILERDLKRARRCIAELRRARDARADETRADASRSDAAIRILTRIAFPGDAQE